MKFNYIFHGDRERDRTQPIVLFLHGFMGDCHDFDGAIEYLSEFCCLVVDLPGHGQTEVEQDSDYQMENIALGLTELLTKLQIERCILVGYSMGGRIALYLTIYFPQFFLGTVLESASPGLATKLERDRRIVRDLQLSDRLETESFADFVNRWYDNSLFRSFRIHPNYQQAIYRRLQNDPIELAKSLLSCGLGQQPSLWARLTEIKPPLLLIVGELDLKFRAINQKMFDFAPQARLAMVENSGHNVHFEHPVKFCQLFKDFAADCHC